MSNDRKFSDVGSAYNSNVIGLDEARQIFEKEVRQLNDLVMDHLYAVAKRLNQDEKVAKKLRWQDPQDDSRNREGPWLNFASRSTIGMDLKTPGAKQFKKNVALLYFETVFDWENEKKFVFQCRFENQNIVNNDFDEKVLELIQAQKEKFPGQVHYKANTTIIFRLKLEDSLFDQINQNIDLALGVCQEVITTTFPDSQYKNEVPELSAVG